MLKRIITLIIALALSISVLSSSFVFAETNAEPSLYIDGQRQSFTPMLKIVDGVIVSPLQGLLEMTQIAYTVNGKTLTLKSREYTVTLNIGSKDVIVQNGSLNKKITFDAAPFEDGGTIYLPVKGISECFGFKYSFSESDNRAVISTKERKEFWFKYPTMAEQDRVDDTNARISRGGYNSDFCWGILAQRKSWEDEKSDANLKKVQGIRIAGYFGAGGGNTWAIGYNKTPEEGIDTLFDVNAWGIEAAGTSKYKYFAYAGIHNEINNEPMVLNVGASREELGYSEPKYPDGRSAVGFNENSPYPYPLNARIYENVIATGITGDYKLDFTFPYAKTDNLDNTKFMKFTVGDRSIRTYPDKQVGDVIYFGGFIYAKDMAAPFWREHSKVSAEEMVKHGIDGGWFDNMSPWANMGGMHNAFGLWSEYTFNQWLKSDFSANKLKEMGIKDIGTFNIREYVMAKAKELEASDVFNTTDSSYYDLAWLDDPVWSAYKIHKARVGNSYLQSMYNTFKEVYELNGVDSGFCIMSNDMPSLNHGWITDNCIDLNSSEINPDWNLTFGSRGVMTPDKGGKMSVFYKTAIETGQSPYMAPWVYANDKIKDKTETGKVYSAEAFINGAFIKAADKTVGTSQSHSWLNSYANKVESTLGIRYTAFDVAILQSPEEQSANAIPADLLGSSNDQQLHMQGQWGFGAALTDAHIPYRVIPLWKFNAQTIRNVKTLILPNIECLDDYMLPILEQFVNDGGRLVVTGPTGRRYGFKGLMERRDTPLLNELIGRDVSKALGIDWLSDADTDGKIYTNTVGKGTVVWTAEPVGFDYWHNDSERAERLPAILEMIGNTKTLLDGTKLPFTVGATVWRSADGRDTFVDLCNYDVDIDNDVVTPANELTFSVRLPIDIDLTGLKAYILSPEIDGYVSNVDMAIDSGFATITVPSLTYMSNIKITNTPVSLETTPTVGAPKDTDKNTNTNTDTQKDSTLPIWMIIAIAGAFILVIFTVIIITLRKKGKKQ